MSGSPLRADIVGRERGVRYGPTTDSCTATRERYSITSSARPKGTVMPSSLAVLRLMIS